MVRTNGSKVWRMSLRTRADCTAGGGRSAVTAWWPGLPAVVTPVLRCSSCEVPQLLSPRRWPILCRCTKRALGHGMRMSAVGMRMSAVEMRMSPILNG